MSKYTSTQNQSSHAVHNSGAVAAAANHPGRAASSTTIRLVTTAMFAALTLLATSVLKISTPTFGYIHIGDCFVLLAGLFLGPIYGGLAAGIGSGLSDLLGGYAIWVPGTFVIKFLTAAVAALVFRGVSSLLTKQLHHAKSGTDSTAANTAGITVLSAKKRTAVTVLAGVTGEAVMVFGYFLYNVLIITLTTGTAGTAGLASAFSVSLAEIPFNLVQGGTGIILATVLEPIFRKIRIFG